MSVESKPLAPETPVELVANGERVAVLMCTPRNLDDLAAGHLFSRGMLKDASRVLTIGACADLRVMTVVAPGAVGADSLGLGQVVASGCGSGSAIADPSVLGRVPPGFSVGLGTLKAWSAAMFRAAELYRETGGMHCASLALLEGGPAPTGPAAGASMDGAPESAAYFTVREDVGRHNAVDKVIGRAFVDRVDFSSSVILTSGRIAADMILKAVAAKVPVLVSRSIPTTTAYELALAAGVTLVGRIGDGEPIVYTSPERIRR
ncbi:MAG: formate dehydrogenase accessory sulfurtransferase FdhD [Spirochaetes bacterium]|nr:formate dehydrogenase accessory sulfurtransferase FdhD [Spirochaetota bacterium]MBU1082283.1 formate dehydrogenase accessory sulfurtransferase FdhD [Spirochaetota bacterium]